jgi:phosphoglycerol transferase MdoB-like AlkP superfamily enzyme
MNKLIRFTLALWIFWLLMFLVHRVFFIVYQWPIRHRIHNSTDALRALYKGYPLDWAMAVSLLGLPVLFAWGYYWKQHHKLRQITNTLVLVMIVLYSAVAIADAGLYHEWQTKINIQALSHFEHPSEVIRTMSFGLLGLFFTCLFISGFIFYTLYKTYIHTPFVYSEPLAPAQRTIPALIFLPLLVLLSVITIRGGINNMPINQSIAYFSTDALANDIAVNPLYNLLQDLDSKSKLPNPALYTFHNNAELPQLVANYFPAPSDSVLHILNTTRPNLLFIFLESWSSHNIGALGGLPNATPNFDAWSKEGLLFKHAYATAYVTDQGLSAVLSGTPSVSRLSVIQQPEWVPKLPCMSEDLQAQGYESSFLFGGDLVFGNLKGYLIDKQFKHISDISNLPPNLPRGSLGLHDEYSMKLLLDSIQQRSRPFLFGYLSQSTHRPYDFPARDTWQGPANTLEPDYTRAVHYSDACLGEFLTAAKKQSWYDSTLIVIVADHSHNTWKGTETAKAERHEIPMLWLGGALDKAWRGKQWEPIVSQLDIAKSILYQMQLPSEHYPWSRNMFQAHPASSSFYIYHGGGGFIDTGGYASYYQLNKNYIFSNRGTSLEIAKRFKVFTAFQQTRYRQLLLE